MRKRNIFSFMIFLAIVFIGDRIGGGVMQRLFMKTGFRYAQMHKGELESDIVVLGNSRGLHMFHPPAIKKVTGHDIANVSFNAMPATSLPIIWEDYLENHEPPKLLILEISCVGTVYKKGTAERLSVLIDQNPKYAELIKTKNPTHYYATKLSRLFRYNSSLMWRSAMFLKKSDQSWIMNSELNQEMLDEIVATSDASLLKTEENVEAIRSVLKLAQARGVKVKVLMAPYYPGYYRRLPDPKGWLDWLTAELNKSESGEPALNVTIEDHSCLLTEAESFADHLHLNERGALSLAEKLHALDFFKLESPDYF